MINFYQRIDPSLLIEFQRHLSRNKKLKKHNTECGSHCLIDIAILKLPWIMPSSAKSLSIKSTPVERVCGLCSSVDHHTDLCPFLHQSGVNEQPEAYAANIYNRPP